MSCFVCQIPSNLFDKIRYDLEEQGFTFSHPPHAVFGAKKIGISCTLYQSGKLTVQGKNKEEFITFYLEPQILKSFPFSHPTVDHSPRIGIDEAGKGDVFGALCIAGVYADEQTIPKLLHLGICDSKKLSDKRIGKIAREIRILCPHKVLIIHPEKYNELYTKFYNLNHLLAWGHATVIETLYQQTGCPRVLIDQFGHQSLVENALKKKMISIDLAQRHRAEEDVVVAAASILARSDFLNSLAQLGQLLHTVLPKGAAHHVASFARQIYQSHGSDALQRLTKMHFKTIQEILDTPS